MVEALYANHLIFYKYPLLIIFSSYFSDRQKNHKHPE